MRIKEFFYLPKSDRGVVVMLLVVGALALAIIYGIGGGRHDFTADATDSAQAESDFGRRGRPAYRGDSRPFGEGQPKTARFVFDPNNADSSQLLALGLSRWQVRALYRYRAAGGVFHKPEDFGRLHGLTVKLFHELRPYIRISPDYGYAADLPEVRANKSKPLPRDSFSYPHKLRPTEHIELNSADTTQLQRVPGIGSYYARRIDNYRRRLGGFYSVSQLQEIDDFPPEAMSYFTIDSTRCRKLNLNKLSLNELKRHPYITYFQAKAICDQRRLRGPLHSLDDLKLLRDFPRQALLRLKPYVEF